MNAEQTRLQDSAWKEWGPYISDRQWGTVREDYSPDGDAWNYSTHDMARSKTYRWSEEGIAGICDDQQYVCFAVAFWNKKDPIIKERYFGLSNPEGNHGEDVKELYYYLDSTPTHSYMKMLYKYPQQEYPYAWLVDENHRRTRNDREFELIDTGIFDQNKYFDIFIEYAKKSPTDILVRITVNNRGDEDAPLHVLPTVWYRNTWAWGNADYKPRMSDGSQGIIDVYHEALGQFWFRAEGNPPVLFCDNETNTRRLYNYDNGNPYCKDGINDHLIHGTGSVNPRMQGTKAAANYDITVPAGKNVVLRMRLTQDVQQGFDDFDGVFSTRMNEADEFYNDLQSHSSDTDHGMIQRQAFAGMLWSKQFYHYDVHQWLEGDPAMPKPAAERLTGRNSKWMHLNNREIISMPDKWEYPWYASWDLAFQCLPLGSVDMAFAKRQLLLLTRDWYMHPNGAIPAYEWDFNEANPPVLAMVTWTLYNQDKEANGGKGDTYFLERIFHKLMLNFTWWVNRKDTQGNNIFEGGFLGLDNIGVFDRNAQLPPGQILEQADGTSWMAMYSLNMLRIAAELTKNDRAYADIASKFFEHFIYIVNAMDNMGMNQEGLWDEDDGFFYDQLRLPDNSVQKMKFRSMVGLIPLFATTILDDTDITNSPIFKDRMKWFEENRPDLASLVSRWGEKNADGKHLLSLLRGHRMKSLLRYMLDENEFLSPHGVRALSKYHLNNPYHVSVDGHEFSVKYTPAESDSGLFGGNSNWRGPIWVPMNYLIIDSLHHFHTYYGDDYKVECPTHSGNFMNLKEVADDLYYRMMKIFLRDESGRRAVFGDYEKLQNDANFKDYILFHEYFDGDNGRGLGASHQTGWTGLVANCLL